MFQKNTKIIWDSGFGYEIGYFLGKINNNDKYLFLMHEDKKIPSLASEKELFLYSEELLKTLNEKYNL